MGRTGMVGLGIALMAAWTSVLVAEEERIRFPADSGIVDVNQRFGAVGDGKTDDTGAIQKSLNWANSGGHEHNILFLKDGTYLVTSTLRWKWFTHLQGESESGVIIKLKDGAAGFGNPQSPKPVLLCYRNTNATHCNYIHNVTVDTGRSNPGAVGIDFTSHNTGAIRHVTIRSGDGAGVAGLSMMRRYPGCCLIQHLTVKGFDRGILTRDSDSYSITFEHITLRGQKVAGIDNGMTIHIRGLNSENTVPAVVNRGPLLLIEANLTGGKQGAAIRNDGGVMYLRDISTDGYAAAVQEGKKLLDGKTVSEHVTGNRISALFPGPKKALCLPIEDPPPTFHEPVDKWVRIDGSKKDDTAGIQAAIDSGAKTIYFSRQDGRSFYVSKPVIVRGNVRRIVGMNAGVRGTSDAAFKGKAVVRFENRHPVVVERLGTGMAKGGHKHVTPSCRIAGPGAVVLRSSGFTILTNAPGAGKLFVEDTNGYLVLEHPQKIWLRQWNPEGFFRWGATVKSRLAVIRKATVWVLGMKTEGQVSKAEITDGAKFELVGGYFLGVDQFPADHPMWIVKNAQASFACYKEHHWPEPHALHDVQIVEVRDGQKRELRRTDELMPDEVMPLYVSGGREPAAEE